MNLMTRLQAAGCRTDGLNFAADRSPIFVNVPTVWTQIQKDAVNAALGLTAPVATAEQNLLAKVDQICEQRLAAGYVDATTNKTYQCDNVSTSRWTAITTLAHISMTASQGQQFSLITADNSVITLSDADTFALFASRVQPWVSSTIFYARSLKDQIVAGNPPADLNAGWP